MKESIKEDLKYFSLSLLVLIIMSVLMFVYMKAFTDLSPEEQEKINIMLMMSS